MYYDNSNPFQYDPFLRLMIKETKKAYSRFHLALFVYVIAAYLISFAVEIILLITLGDSYTDVVSNNYYRWGLGVLPMYLVGLPILYLIVREMPSTPLQKSKLKFSEFLILFAIAQPLTSVGAAIGSVFNGVFGALRGEEVTDATTELITSSPIVFTILFAVIIGPVVEEFIFRKLMVDKLSKFGTVPAIIVSGVSFGLFHGNFYQFFYAALLGVLLAFITVKTGNWLYSVLMHVVLNFFGSVVPMPFMDMSKKIANAQDIISAGGTVNTREFLFMNFAVSAYSSFQLLLLLAGVILLILALKRQWYKIDKNVIPLRVPGEKVFSSVFATAGSIMFFALSMLLLTVNALFL